MAGVVIIVLLAPVLVTCGGASGVDETGLREAVATYERAIARADLETAYALEPADFRETCPFEEYRDMFLAARPQFLDDCGFTQTSRVDFVIEWLEIEEDQAMVGGCFEDQSGRQCCYHDSQQWSYRGGELVHASTLPCVYAQENKRLLATLLELPGAEELSIHSYVYSRCEGGCPLRHAIRVTYRAPREITAEGVIDFYVQALAAEWQHAVDEHAVPQGSFLIARFTQGMAKVSVDTAGMLEGGPHTFDVHVDYRGAEPR